MSAADFDELSGGRDEEAATWCMRLAEEPLSLDEQRLFDAWLALPGNAEAFDDAVLVWRTAEAAAHRPEMIHARAEALDAYRAASARRWKRGRATRWAWPAGIAAAILLILLAGVAMFRDPAQIYETGIGERRIAMLEDGSRLSLDAATKVEVRMHGDRRDLRLLTGRAKFDVAKDPLRPFSVQAGGKVVVATGTSFSVELLRSQVRVLLYEGHVEVLEQAAGEGGKPRQVRLTAAGDSAEARLTPGHELVAPSSLAPATIVAADVPRSLAWEAGQLSFEDEPLQSAVERMNRYSQAQLAVGDAKTGDIRVSGVFTAGDTDAFVEGVTALHPVVAETREGRTTLKGK